MTTPEEEALGGDPTPELRFVRRKVQFAGNAEPAFRLILQQKWVRTWANGATAEAWLDIPTVNEPD